MRAIDSRIESLKNAVAYGLEHGKKNLIVDLDLLAEIFRGNVAVGGNEYPPEEVNRKLYEVKAQRDKLLWALSRIADMASDDLRRGGMVGGTSVYQIEADARTVLDEVRAAINPPMPWTLHENGAFERMDELGEDREPGASDQ